MRDYVLHQASQLGYAPGQGLLVNLLRNWRARRAVARLDQFDDHILRDIGVTRDEIREAVGVSLNENAALVLHETARQRRLKFGRFSSLAGE